MTWIAHLEELSNCSKTDLNFYIGLLSDKEKHRWKNYSNHKKRTQFLLGRVLIRMMLTEKFQWPLEEWSLTENGPVKILNFKFPVTMSISHSGDYVLCAIAGSGSLGIDIEYISDSRQYMDIAEASFNKKEIQILQGLTEPMRRQTFYRIWTLKESLIKANELDLFGNLDCLYAVSCDQKMSMILTVKPELSSNWTFISCVIDKYALAIAADSQISEPELHYISLKGRNAHLSTTTSLKPFIQNTV